jgi:hypothetical protein
MTPRQPVLTALRMLIAMLAEQVAQAQAPQGSRP